MHHLSAGKRHDPEAPASRLRDRPRPSDTPISLDKLPLGLSHSTAHGTVRAGANLPHRIHAHETLASRSPAVVRPDRDAWRGPEVPGEWSAIRDSVDPTLPSPRRSAADPDLPGRGLSLRCGESGRPGTAARTVTPSRGPAARGWTIRSSRPRTSTSATSGFPPGSSRPLRPCRGRGSGPASRGAPAPGASGVFLPGSSARAAPRLQAEPAGPCTERAAEPATGSPANQIAAVTASAISPSEKKTKSVVGIFSTRSVAPQLPPSESRWRSIQALASPQRFAGA